MERRDLIPPTHYAERLFLLDVLAEGTSAPRFEMDCDADTFLAITPPKLYPLVYVRLKDHAERLGIPPAVLDTLAAHYRANVLRELRRVADLQRINATLAAAGIPFLVLKGPVLAAAVYPDPASRTMTDLDLLVAEGDVPRILELLETIGYRVPARFDGSALPAGDVPALIRDEPGGLSLELHWMLDSLPDERAALAAVSSSARRVPVGHGLELPTLGREEFFAHVVVHVSKHHRFEDELRSLLDVALLLRGEAATLDWNALDDVWQRRGIADWIGLTVTLAHILLRSPLPAFHQCRAPSDEALSLAAEQLWASKSEATPASITFALAGRAPAPVHERVEGGTRPIGTGIAGAISRAARLRRRAGRLMTAMRHGRLRPAVVRSEVDLFLKRERLFALMQNKD